jgi:hypothetical protein
MDNRKVLLLGSGLSALQARTIDLDGFTIVAINNAWKVVPNWNYLIFPCIEHFSDLPATLGPDQHLLTSDDYGPYIDLYGGEPNTGDTMFFNASYWIMHAIRPDVIACLGCDMHYPEQGNNTFYGVGNPDPLRLGVENLPPFFDRLDRLAAANGFRIVNLSAGCPTLLPYERIEPDQVDRYVTTMQAARAFVQPGLS